MGRTIIKEGYYPKIGGLGKSREDLKLVIDSSIKFFKSKLN